MFEDAVIDRLFALNATRAEEEKVKGLGGPASKQKTKADKSATKAKAAVASSDGPTPKKRAPRAKKQPPPEQLAMPSPTEGSEP